MGVDWAAMEVVFSLEFWRMAVLWTLSLLFSYVQLLRPSPSFPRRRFSPDPASRVKRPICVVTGATSGLGRAAAKALAGEGYHVVLAGRCPQLLSKTIEEIKQQHGDARLNAFQVDLSSIHSIMKFESSLKQWLLDSNLHPSIQLLINNAGMLAKSLRVTVDGFDQMLETNYIGAFALTNLLMPLLKSSTVPSRIVNVTSFTHRCASGVGVDKDTLARKNLCCLSTSKKYPLAGTYEYSKLCLLLFSYELRRQLCVMDPTCTVSVIPADPGAVETNIMRELPPCLSQLAFLVLRFLHLLQSPECGVDSILDAALAPPEASGKYFFGGKGRTIKSSSLSYNEKLAEKLWSASFLLFQEAKCRVPKSAGT
ncbi:dehydrogenase/reductase SDR family member on chromosome X [Cocos nucifera]|uniref:Dehydrogenase/reductase SDR family member on chromosome X n=1 Tax=Cocos nucifera TaxID=13894 RepID=A0A8K0N308_COCNU|nr:dehydrogenase/reductase SDR family member on chromosome X [Cocos nucifera]